MPKAACKVAALCCRRASAAVDADIAVGELELLGIALVAALSTAAAAESMDIIEFVESSVERACWTISAP
jgi:hypothetical protein